MEGRGEAGEGVSAMITVTASNGSKGRGGSLEAACRDLIGGPRKMAVKLGRGMFIPVDEASPAQLRVSGAIWVNKDRGWHIAMLVDDVAEAVS